MTGSRTVFVLGMLMLVVLAFRQKGERIFYLLILAGAVCAGGIYGVLTGNLENIGRFLTISLGESTLQGRFLYWIDGISILKEHIWGLGYRGYCEIQGMYQTGVYKVQFIHNEYLQILLDIGVLLVAGQCRRDQRIDLGLELGFGFAELFQHGGCSRLTHGGPEGFVYLLCQIIREVPGFLFPGYAV